MVRKKKGGYNELGEIRALFILSEIWYINTGNIKIKIIRKEAEMKAVITTYEEKSQFNIVLDTETDDEKDTLERLYNILRSVKKPILKTAYLSARYPNSRSKCNRVSFGVEVE